MVTPARVARAKVCAAETVAEHHRGRGQHPWSSCHLLVGEHALAEHHEAQMDQAPVNASAMMVLLPGMAMAERAESGQVTGDGARGMFARETDP